MCTPNVLRNLPSPVLRLIQEKAVITRISLYVMRPSRTLQQALKSSLSTLVKSTLGICTLISTLVSSQVIRITRKPMHAFSTSIAFNVDLRPCLRKSVAIKKFASL
eukprot:gnl/MRDRNA2_/MRDRNA2_81312_c0_seq2.p1 gnl/MRDRNA2_/MRDRNA2_81312_c0~~gnl/MRDRNA2_/MRDRNA2_81312_c0_seq2.p1  ORF type:complete len:106 (+),score=5.72 gnl/MRDRNA2_/MRDRNA2_81312_c0_seq2:326-643(+)